MPGNSHKHTDDISDLPENDHDGLGSLVDELPIGMLSCDREGNITAVNDFLLKILGSPSAEATKKINILTFTPLLESGISASIQKALTTGETASIETPYRSKWGKELFVSFRTFPRKDASGNIHGCYAIVENLTSEMDANFEIENNRIKDQIITRISDRFINTSLSDIDTNITITLKELADFIGADRAVLFSTDENTDFLLKTHEWHTDGIVSRIPLNEKGNYKKLISSEFNNSQIINIPDVNKMPEDRKDTQKILQELGIVSIAMIPFSHHEHFKGFISVDSKKKRHNWEEKDLHLLKIAGNLVASILERKNTENLLLEKEKEYENTIDSLDAIIWKATFDHEGNAIQTYISKPMDKMLGFPADTIGNDWDRFFEHIHQDDIENILNNLKLAFSNPSTPVNVEYRVLSDDGKTTWVNSLGSSYPIGDGIYQMFGTTSNINDRKNAEEQRRDAERKLADSEEKLRMLIEHAPLALVMLDRDMKHISSSKLMREYFGLGDTDITGLYHYDVFPQIDNEYFRETHQSALKGESICIDEGGIKLPDGSMHWSRIVVQPWKEADGTIGGLTVFTDDITERKHTQDKLRESEALLSEVSRIGKIGGWTLDVKSNTVIWTSEVARIQELGDISDPSESLNLFLPESRKKLEKALNEAIKEAEPYELELELISGKGNHKWIRAIGKPLTENGKVTKLTGTLQDITERKKAEAAILNAKIEAEIANRTKSDFLANMSHELRTPLNSIIGFSDAMVDGIAGEIDSKQEHYLQNISDSGHHLLSLINNILDISKIEAGKMELNIDMIDISAPVNEIVIMTQMLAVNKNLTVDVNLSDDLPKVMADRSKIKQILYNLIGNAIKFTNDNGNITIRAEVKDSNLQLSIIDTGIGISPKDQEKLFKPFTQIDSSRSRKYAGTGLGLALVKEIVECHGGKVWVESEPGKGSNFTFELPIDINF